MAASEDVIYFPINFMSPLCLLNTSFISLMPKKVGALNIRDFSAG